MADVDYLELPLLRHSALVHLIDQVYGIIEEKMIRSHQVSEKVVQEFYRVSQQKSIALVVAGITDSESTRDMLTFCRARGIPSVNISVDLEKEGNRNLPHDLHPSAKANAEYAAKLEAYLRSQDLD
jgi:siroheme synthase (precorrin-2 oxidase/ferrochelatase)